MKRLKKIPKFVARVLESKEKRRRAKGNRKELKLMKRWSKLSNGNYSFGNFMIIVVRRGHKSPLGTLYRCNMGKLMVPAVFSGKLRDCLLWSDGSYVGPDQCVCLSRQRTIRREGDVVVQRCESCGRLLDSMKDHRVSGKPEVVKALIAEAFEAMRAKARNVFPDEVYVDEKYSAVTGYIKDLEDKIVELQDLLGQSVGQLEELRNDVSDKVLESKEVGG